ncbi:hypothetical protein VNO80_33214 [Phaseolus coccineus]|uniref:Uncharacterized protein n=1 Tax=Phaseolus coccineus TaxID=3886 RepID=A0AAN9KYD9_PHACN
MRMLLLAGSMPRASNGQTRIPLVATLPWFSTIGYNPPWMTPDPQCEMGGVCGNELHSRPTRAGAGATRMDATCYSLFDGIYYSDNRSNSRANTCNKPRLLEGTHLLDKRSTQALPVALMIHDNSSDRTALVPATHHSNFCPINFRW